MCVCVNMHEERGGGRKERDRQTGDIHAIVGMLR